jgi:release factor glutamine methyltransferase
MPPNTPPPADAPTVDAALRRAREIGVDRLDAQLLVAHVLGRDRAWVVAHAEEPLERRDAKTVAVALARRAAGEPLAYIVEHREFHGLSLRVSPAVLIPRADTETLVDAALSCLAGPLSSLAHPSVADLGTGSGAIALALKHRCPRARLVASDTSAAALEVARTNAAALGLDVEWRIGDWWAAFATTPSTPLDLVVANPPYVAADDPHLPSLSHEPRSALVPCEDDGQGLADLGRIIAGASAHLASGGWILLEHGAQQAEAVRWRLTEQGFSLVRTWLDLAGRERVTGGSWSPAVPR